MTEVYVLQSGKKSPLSLGVLRQWIKAISTCDDDLLLLMIEASTTWAEKYTGRDLRQKTWKLLLDCFPDGDDPIVIRRDPVVSITSINHLVSDVLTLVPSTVYYLVKRQQTSEIRLLPSQSWPTNTDDRDQGIEIIFVTQGFFCEEEIILGLIRLISFWYANRGDCNDAGAAAVSSGAVEIFNQFRISRV